MDKIINFFQGEMNKPGIFSWFHFFGLVLIVSATILVSYYFKDVKEKTYKRILLVGWIILIVVEIGKQIVKAFHYGPPSYWEYNFYDLPFHVCSMCFYLLPILIFVKKEKCPHLIDAVNGFLCFTVLLAGIIVCCYTDIVMSRLIYTNVQTLIHHGMQVVLGVYIFVWNRKNITIKTYLKSLIVFVVLAAIALVINVSLWPRETDMFYLNPYKITAIPLGNLVQEKAGFAVYAIGYTLAVFLGSLVVYFVETSIYKLVLKRKSK